MNVVTVAPQSVAVRSNNNGAGRIVTGYAVRVDGRTVKIYDNYQTATALAEKIKGKPVVPVAEDIQARPAV